MQPKITIITGPTCTGKTTLAQKILGPGHSKIESQYWKNLNQLSWSMLPSEACSLFDGIDAETIIILLAFYTVNKMNGTICFTTQSSRSEIEKYTGKCNIRWIEISRTDMETKPQDEFKVFYNKETRSDKPFFPGLDVYSSPFGFNLNNILNKIAIEGIQKYQMIKKTTTTSAILAEAHAIQLKINSFIKELESCEIKH